MSQLFASVILPLALPQNYTYEVPQGMQAALMPGMRVVVPLGKRKLYTGIVKEITAQQPKDFEPKPILEIEGDEPIVTPAQLELWNWISRYYMCSEGEVMMAALPAGLKLESETIVVPNRLKKIVDEELSDHEFLIVEALQAEQRLSIQQIAQVIGLKNPLPIIKNLLGKHYVLLEEEIKSGYKPKKKRMVRLHTHMSEETLPQAFEKVSKAAAQSRLLMAFLGLKQELGKEEISAARLLKKAETSDSVLKALAEKEILEITQEDDVFEPGTSTKVEPLPALNSEQLKALGEIKAAFESKPGVLLHGVTSSGKTQVYTHLIDEQLQQHNQVLFLVPEIALTTQLIKRLRTNFGDKVLVYHSRFSDRQRIETWLHLLKNPDQPFLIVGARSSIFLPFNNLKYIIVDEEHETSFKQYEPAPRYHARDVSFYLMQKFGGKVLLGSATPSLESYYRTEENKLGLAVMEKRFGNIPLPLIECVDLKAARRKKELYGPFSKTLRDAMEETLKAGKQIILFQNRRGFSTIVQCQNCGYVAECKNCDITLTYHKHTDLLRCHYCGFTRQVPQKCPACSSHEIRSFGFGTEKLEDDLKLMFPAASVKRMDLDTTRKKNAYENIITDFEDGEIDILVGTQMVTKGLDFENVALVGILNADTMLHFPDFRSHERAYQVLSQVAGRAGRKGLRGKVLIQTSDPYHNVIRKVLDHQYHELYKDERYERKNFKYPPFTRLLQITLKHKDVAVVREYAVAWAQQLRQIFGKRVLGPEMPPTGRLRNKYIFEIMLKFENEASPGKVKRILQQSYEDFDKAWSKGRVQVIFDVDPF